jgi:two-component system response regulator ArlR
MSKILLVDDDQESRASVQTYFQTRGFDVVAAEKGSDGLARFQEERPDAVLLSKGLDGAGYAVCRSLRNHPDPDTAKVAVMFVADQADLPERIAAFESGADDFVQKPTALEEIFARVQALLRRSKGTTVDVLAAGELRMDRVRHRVTRAGEEIPLTLTEYNLLEYLLRNKNVALSRKDILKAVWGGTVDGFTNIVDVYINYLRKKIERPEQKKMLKTVRGIGYMLEE